MHKKKFSDEQQELVALLPDGLPKMTESAKLVLANIILLYGRDFAKENGYTFRSYEDMMKDTGIKSRTTIRNAYRKIESLGLMDVKSGNFENEVSNEFYLSDEMKQKIHFKPKCTEGTLSGTLSGTLCQNDVIRQLIDENKSFRLSINELTEQIKSLTETVKTLEKNSKCTTDTESLSNNYTTGTSCTGTCCKGNKKESILTDTKEKPEETCGKCTSDEYIQPPARPYFFDPRYFGKPAEKRTEAKSVSSSLQLIEEENHPDTNNPSDDYLIQADRLNLSQSFSKTQPQPLDKGNASEWLKNIRSELKHEVYEWSLTLTCTPEYLTGDDYNPIVTKVMNNHPEWINYQGQFSLCELGQYTLQLMENRMNNSDITGIIAKNNRKRYPDFNDNTNIVSESTVRLREAV